MTRARAIHRLVTRVPAEYADAVSDALAEAGATAVEEVPGARGVLLRTYGPRAALEAMANAARSLFAEEKLRRRVDVGPASERQASWRAAAAGPLVPVRVSPSLVIAPRPDEGTRGRARRGPVDEFGGAKVVRLSPAFAFGHGEHMTTVMAARSVERACAPGVRSVLDVGTGTGVLAIAAVLAGAERAVGIDVDPAAVRAARTNARLSGVAGRCRFAMGEIGTVGERFPVVVANLDYRLQHELGPAIVRAVEPGGVLAVTGFLREHARDVSGLYAGLGLRKTGRTEVDGGWALVVFRAAGSSARRSRARRTTARGTSPTRGNR